MNKTETKYCQQFNTIQNNVFIHYSNV